jgi:hypothetical protein
MCPGTLTFEWCCCICCSLQVPIFPGPLTWGCCCICCCSHVPIFAGTLTSGDVVVSAVVYMIQYFQELSPRVFVVVVYAVIDGCCCSLVPIFQGLSPGDEVAISAAVNRF